MGLPVFAINVLNNGDGADPRVTEILKLIPDQATEENKLADKDFVNSSINSVSAFPITYNASGDGFPTISALLTATTYYSGGAVRVPTTNDYAFVTADTSKATPVSGYTEFTTTAQYIGSYVMYNNISTLVTSDNKDSVGITPGTTVAYIAIPSTRYVYSIPEGQTTGAWNFQTVVTPISLTAAQIKALNSGITAALVELIRTALQGVTINGVSIVDENGIARIPMASGTDLGAVKIGGSGLAINPTTGLVSISAASGSTIENKNSAYQPIVPTNLDKAIMEGLGNNSLTWSDIYKAAARATIGIKPEMSFSCEMADGTTKTLKLYSELV